jgi:hypothetical protein
MPLGSLACEDKRMACERRAQCQNGVIVFSSESDGRSGKDTTMRTLFLATAAFALALAGPAYAETNGEASIILDGIATHGSIVCNPHWLDRQGSYIIVDLARAAHANGANDETMRSLLKRGMADFDKSVKELGKKGACQKLDHLLDEIAASK